MEIKELVDFIFQYGIGTICVGYLIYFNATTMKEMLKSLQSINERLCVIEDKMENKKEGD